MNKFDEIVRMGVWYEVAKWEEYMGGMIDKLSDNIQRQMDGQTKLDGGMDRWIGWWTVGWMDGWIYG